MQSEKAELVFKQLEAPQRLVIYCIGSVSKPLKSEIALQKLIFLCNIAAPEMFGNVFQFKQHKQGPYAAEINETLNIFRDEGLIGPANSLTLAGKEVFKFIVIANQLQKVIEDYENFILDLTDDEIMTFVYTAHPKQIKESEE